MSDDQVIYLCWGLFLGAYVSISWVIFRDSKLRPKSACLVFAAVAPCAAILLLYGSFKVMSIIDEKHIEHISGYIYEVNLQYHGYSRMMDFLVSMKYLSLIVAFYGAIPILGLSALYNLVKYVGRSFDSG